MNTSTNPRIVAWREQLVELDFQYEVNALEKLNEFVNADVDYVDDYHHFHKADYWAEPETVLTEGGDCEDIALVKAATLRRFNWPGDKVHLLVGFLTERGKKESHAVLLVETSEGEQLVMRSINDDVVPLSKFPFVPVYAVDRYGTLIVKSKSPHHLLHTEKTARQKEVAEVAVGLRRYFLMLPQPTRNDTEGRAAAQISARPSMKASTLVPRTLWL
jgi:predicted transglutaminase-like cysteine proteinase